MVGWTVTETVAAVTGEDGRTVDGRPTQRPRARSLNIGFCDRSSFASPHFTSLRRVRLIGCRWSPTHFSESQRVLPTTTRSSRASQMGNQSSTSAPPPPLSYSHSSPSSSSHSPTPSTEPSNSSECHACASTPDSPALSPLPSPLPTSPLSSSPSPPPCYAYSHSSCPLNRAELGRASWAYLHTLAAYYPTSPSPSQQSTMSQFLSSYAALYPCGYCADRTVEELTRNPPRVGSQGELSVWMCEVP